MSEVRVWSRRYPDLEPSLQMTIALTAAKSSKRTSDTSIRQTAGEYTSVRICSASTDTIGHQDDTMLDLPGLLADAFLLRDR